MAISWIRGLHLPWQREGEAEYKPLRGKRAKYVMRELRLDSTEGWGIRPVHTGFFEADKEYQIRDPQGKTKLIRTYKGSPYVTLLDE